MNTPNTRFIACQILHLVITQHQPFDPEYIVQRYPKLSSRDRDFVVNLIFGVLRWFWLLEALIAPYLDKKLKPKDFDIQLLLCLGVYQLLYLKTPAFAAIHETVSGCVPLKKVWAKGLINAVLKKIARLEGFLETAYPIEIKTAHPPWLVDLIQKDWPQDFESILSENNLPAPLFLRVNPKQITRNSYLEKLVEEGIEAQAFEHTDVGILLKIPVKISALPGFEKGWLSIQDGAAQLAADLLELSGALTVLDACSAPGGKTAHILEQADPRTQIFAVEKASKKIPRLEANLNRLGLSAKIVNKDATQLQDHWPPSFFDRILLDAPCSATGIIRRHPDIKHHRTGAQLADLQLQQTNLLDALWPLLKPNGILVYSTCSILKLENETQIHNFLQRTPGACEMPIEANWGKKLTHGRQIFPGESKMDGFYYAKIKKVS